MPMYFNFLSALEDEYQCIRGHGAHKLELKEVWADDHILDGIPL